MDLNTLNEIYKKIWEAKDKAYEVQIHMGIGWIFTWICLVYLLYRTV